MIFKQIPEILSGAKWQIRCVVKPGEMLWKVDPPCEIVTSGGRIKWETFTRTYAVQPGCGMPGVWWHPVDGGVELLHEHPEWPAFREGLNTSRATWRLALENLKARGFQPLRIRILAIRQERLQGITEADAKAEGVSSKGEYAKLWNRINKRKGTRWSDNPLVWVLTFEVVKEKGAQS